MLTWNFFSSLFAGDMDFLKKHGEALLESFINPYVIRHPKGHTVPRLGEFYSYRPIKDKKFLLNLKILAFVFADDRSLETMRDFLQKIENDLHPDAPCNDKHEEVHLS
ncbi:hypothetical protein BHM03_00052851 [Ensete ventricosum]|nr:hypothetical protein BHM03_00052851 [Ensete ventricosum]